MCIIEGKRDRVLVEIQVRKIVFRAVAEKRLVCDVEDRQLAQKKTEFWRQPLDQKIFSRINIGVEERTGKRESGVLRCRGTNRKSIFRRVSKSGPHGKVEKTPRAEPCASRVDVNRELNILDERAAGFETP